jgi:hypothetical protein
MGTRVARRESGFRRGEPSGSNLLQRVPLDRVLSFTGTAVGASGEKPLP